jgi:hypothetical protein
MNLFQVDDAGCLFISPAIEDWSLLASKQIDTIFDLEGGLDTGVPTVPDQCLYVYFPIYDDAMPNVSKLTGLASLGASLIQDGHHVLSHGPTCYRVAIRCSS